VALFRLLEGSYSFADCGKAKMSGKYRLECQLTLRAGQVVYDPYGLSMPEWPDAPQAYWELKQ
jgi:dihydroorotase